MEVDGLESFFFDDTGWSPDTDDVMSAAAVGRSRLGPSPLVVCSSLTEGRSIVWAKNQQGLGGDDYDATIRNSFIWRKRRFRAVDVLHACHRSEAPFPIFKVIRVRVL